MGNNIILETKFVADIRGSFYIPSYQRGYRWSETEVVRLLDDIYQNGKKNYCLQPVVVRKKGDQYELIDGQQRLTTLSVSGNTEYMHSIANLALLNTADNAALNNSTFDVKRNDIIQMDKKGQYIPFCTKMVFLKYYTPSAENQLHFWGQADRIAYIKAINDVLSDYIEPIVLEKEETK